MINFFLGVLATLTVIGLMASIFFRDSWYRDYWALKFDHQELLEASQKIDSAFIAEVRINGDLRREITQLRADLSYMWAAMFHIAYRSEHPSEFASDLLDGSLQDDQSEFTDEWRESTEGLRLDGKAARTPIVRPEQFGWTNGNVVLTWDNSRR
jgi:hypothetical protein